MGRPGRRVALATVIGVKRSAPRPPGAKMAVNERGEVTGAVSGGCVEGAVVEVAEDVLEGGPPRLLHFGIADSEAWDVGLPCGGEIAVFVESTSREPQGFRRSRAQGRTRARSSPIPRSGGAASRRRRRPRGHARRSPCSARAGERADELMWAERSEPHGDLFVDVALPPPRLLSSAPSTSRAALCTVAAPRAGARTWSTRAASPTRRASPTPRSRRGLAGGGVPAAGRIDRATSIAVLTHDPKLDDAALGRRWRSDASYIGAMGSRRAQAPPRAAAGRVSRRRARARRRPIGLDLGALTAEETALSIMSEIVAVRNGRTGGRLRDAQGRIHEVGRVTRPAIGGLVLAAGAARRFGAPQQLALLRGGPLLAHVLETPAPPRSPAGRGPRPTLGPRLRLPLHRAPVVECTDWREGQAASLREGSPRARSTPPSWSSGISRCCRPRPSPPPWRPRRRRRRPRPPTAAPRAPRGAGAPRAGGGASLRGDTGARDFLERACRVRARAAARTTSTPQRCWPPVKLESCLTSRRPWSRSGRRS